MVTALVSVPAAEAAVAVVMVPDTGLVLAAALVLAMVLSLILLYHQES